MGHVWDAEVSVSIRQAEKLIESQFPALIPADIKIIDYGFDNTVMKVNQDWIFRFPRREVAVKLIETEGKLLPLLSERKLGLQFPVPVYYGKPSSLYRWPFLGYRFVDGTIPSRANRVKREGESALKMAQFLKRLHGTNGMEARERGVPDDELDRLNVEKRVPVLQANLKEIKELNLFHQIGRLEEYLQRLPNEPLPREATLVHGDLHFKNIVVDTEGNVSGVIDWGDVHLGQRAVDLNVIFSFLTPEGREWFLEEYGEVRAIELEYARFKAIYTNVVLLLYGYHEKQFHTEVEARNSLELALT
ncbi:phosphotransferase [Rossellomorea sp. AcN35-11]|nr:phosphotransferase [Rossellomorea aquimaris]WJV30110.1 phosphotransferase [Rossellomorea sp. AcN35-11]